MYHKMQVLLNFMIDMMCSHLFVAAHCIKFFFLVGKNMKRYANAKFHQNQQMRSFCYLCLLLLGKVSIPCCFAQINTFQSMYECTRF